MKTCTAARLNRLDLQDNRSGRTKHERLKDYLVDEMTSGRLKPGQPLPSEHYLVETLGIARMTVRQAIGALETDGLIYRVQGKGAFVVHDARRKLQGGQDIFALVAPDTSTGFYPSLLAGFEATSSEKHHQTIICNSGNDVPRQGDIILQLIDREVGGVALVPTSIQPTPAYQVRQLQKHKIPLVFCHRRVEGVAAPLLAIPFREVGRMAGDALVEQGHRRVVFLTTHESPVTKAYEAGLNEALLADDSPIPAKTVCLGNSIAFDEKTLLVALEKTFANPKRPTAVFASFDSLAEMIYLLLPRLGLRVPEDVSIVGFGGSLRTGALERRITSVVIDEVATGRQAASLLHEMRTGVLPIDDNTETSMELGLSEGETISSIRSSEDDTEVIETDKLISV
jgi:GntR family transcriptional regulator, arabinose operon transcriptional repressor